MSCTQCGAETCGCCAGTEVLTPHDRFNRPGLPALRYRVGNYGEFFNTMRARLATMRVTGVAADGQTLETFQPLTGLTTRAVSDPAIALLDGWASVGDVLSFYQERIANEGYLATATERRSVLELTRLTGYNLKPGVAASVFLAYTLDDKQTEPVLIPTGARVQSTPGPDELPQSFETSEDFTARPEWNALDVRLSRPQNISYGNVLGLKQFYVGGTTTGLKAGDLLLFRFNNALGVGQPGKAVRTVAAVAADFAKGRTLVSFAALPLGTAEALPLLNVLITTLDGLAVQDPNSLATDAARIMRDIREQAFAGTGGSPLNWASVLDNFYDGTDPDGVVEPFIDAIADVVQAAGGSAPLPTTSTDDFVAPLLKPPRLQPRSSVNLSRSVARNLGRGVDAHPQLLLKFAPRLRESYYQAWANATVNNTAAVTAVFVLRAEVPIFGAGAQKIPTFTAQTNGNDKLDPPSQWDDWDLEQDERFHPETLYLDGAVSAVQPGSFVVVDRPDGFGGIARRVHAVRIVTTRQRAAYGVNGKTTQVDLDESWRPDYQPQTNSQAWKQYRETLIHAQSEALELIAEPITEAVSGQSLELATLHKELQPGRWVIACGERADIAAVRGVKVAELLMISAVSQTYDPTLPGDQTHTTLSFATPTAYQYQREGLRVYANVIKATHGETRLETLGSGNGAQAFQAFMLRSPPLTYVPASTSEGAASTLQVRVNGVLWHEQAALVGQSATARVFASKTDDAANTMVIFGNGINGARLPTGVENIQAQYRSGIGQGGNVRAGQLNLLLTRPQGVKEVLNPLRASGGADAESRDQARENAPLAVTALDRLVSITDYADFTRRFSGIGKAVAQRVSDGTRELVFITIAGADDIAIDTDSDLYRNLLAALRSAGDTGLPLRVEVRELLVLVLSANVAIHPDYRWDDVVLALRAKLLDAYGFAHRALAQPALLSEIISFMQAVPGVVYVDVDAFGGLPEKVADFDGSRQLITLDELAARAQAIAQRKPFVPAGVITQIPFDALNGGFAGGGANKFRGVPTRVRANDAGLEGGVLRPAQLAIFTPAVPDTLILQQILPPGSAT